MKTVGWLVLLLLVAAGAGFGGYWYARQHAATTEATAGDSKAATAQPAEEKAVVPVTVMPLARRTITETAVAYGTVAAQPGEVRVLSVPFESRVARVLVTAGRRDPICPPDLTMRLEAWLRADGADVTMEWHEGGHELRPNEIAAARRFLCADGTKGMQS